MKRQLKWYDAISINIYWFALTTRSQVLTPLIIPLLVQQFVGDASKGTYVGIIRLWALMLAVLIQSGMGMLSDRSMSKYGRRRPFIIAGTIGEIIVFILIGFSTGLEGMTGFWVLFVLYLLSMLSSNTAHAATQGLIPDLVPDEKRGLYSGIKALLELPIPLIFVSFVIGKMVSAGNLWAALITLAAVLFICSLLSLFVPEKPRETPPPSIDWKPIFRLISMTVVFTISILGMGYIVNTLLKDLVPNHGASIYAGVFGFIGMLLAIVFGVWMSTRLGLGDKAKDHATFRWWIITRLSFLVGATNMAGFMVFFLQERFTEFQGEKAAAPASQLIMFVGIFILLSSLPGGWLSDKINKKFVVALSSILAFLGSVIVVIAPTLSIMFVGASIIGIGVGLFYSSNWALGTEIVPTESAGEFLGISNLAGAGAGAIGAYIGGPIGDTHGYVILMAIYGALFLFTLLPLYRIKLPTIS